MSVKTREGDMAGDKHSPLLGQGGVAAPKIKCREASSAGADGVVGSTTDYRTAEQTTPSAPAKEASRHFY
jgi:hypothetical protein